MNLTCRLLAVAVQTMAWILDEYSKFHGHCPAVVTGKPVVKLSATCPLDLDFLPFFLFFGGSWYFVEACSCALEMVKAL